MQIKNKLKNLIVSTFLLLFVNKIMFTKCFFLLQKCFFFAKWGFFAKNVLFFLGRALFLSVFFAKVHYNPGYCIYLCISPLSSYTKGMKKAMPSIV